MIHPISFSWHQSKVKVLSVFSFIYSSSWIFFHFFYHLLNITLLNLSLFAFPFFWYSITLYPSSISLTQASLISPHHPFSLSLSLSFISPHLPITFFLEHLDLPSFFLTIFPCFPPSLRSISSDFPISLQFPYKFLSLSWISPWSFPSLLSLQLPAIM